MSWQNPAWTESVRADKSALQQKGAPEAPASIVDEAAINATVEFLGFRSLVDARAHVRRGDDLTLRGFVLEQDTTRNFCVVDTRYGQRKVMLANTESFRIAFARFVAEAMAAG